MSLKDIIERTKNSHKEALQMKRCKAICVKCPHMFVQSSHTTKYNRDPIYTWGVNVFGQPDVAKTDYQKFLAAPENARVECRFGTINLDRDSRSNTIGSFNESTGLLKIFGNGIPSKCPFYLEYLFYNEEIKEKMKKSSKKQNIISIIKRVVSDKLEK
jgi:hypothetical protein